MAKDIRWKWLEERGIKVYGDEHQLSYMKSLWADVKEVQSVFCEARAGTGKTVLATLAGAYEVERGTYDRIIYIRNTVAIRDSGFLPGGIAEKEAPYMSPVADALELIKPGTFEEWAFVENGDQPKLVPITTSYVRGTTWNNAFVIVDEAQNFDLEELQAVLTRCTSSTKIVVIGSARQCDNRKIRRYGKDKLLPFEVFTLHFSVKPYNKFHTLVKCYRGDFADHADDIQLTVKRLEHG